MGCHPASGLRGPLVSHLARVQVLMERRARPRHPVTQGPLVSHPAWVQGVVEVLEAALFGSRTLHMASNRTSIRNDDQTARSRSKRLESAGGCSSSALRWSTSALRLLRSCWMDVLGRTAPDSDCCRVSGSAQRCSGPTQGRRARCTLAPVRPPGHSLSRSANSDLRFSVACRTWPRTAPPP